MKILKSLVIVVAMVAMVTGATSSIFTSQATVAGNTFATGTLEIRIDGLASIPGFTVENAIPGTCKTGQFTLENYGPPWFAGPSTVSAKVLTMSAVKTAGDLDLYNALTIHMTKTAGSSEDIWNSDLYSLTNRDALMSWYHPGGLIAGSSETINYEVCLPLSAGNDLQGKSTTFDFVADASSS